ncbi:cytochrome P450 [Tricholoma matsutake]|nr:cytochrome P450 [Tricholoma matsutake 945]
MPKYFEWVTYHKWCKEFDSEIIHLNIAGTSLVVLDTSEATTELLERRSSIYSDRARMLMAKELMGWDFHFAFMRYGKYLHQHRMLMHQTFHQTASMRFRPLELKAVHGLLRHMLEDPDDLIGHLWQMAGETIISIAYGLDVLPKDDPYVSIAEKCVHSLVVAAIPGTFLVDTFPWLKYVPDWMPLAHFKCKAKEWQKLALTMVEMPFEAGKRKLESGQVMPSFLSYSLENMDETRDITYQTEVIKGIAGAMYTAGSETTMSAIASCVLGLVTHPEVLEKTQAEIDAIVGLKQLPDFDDFDSLPYITAIAKETLRWRDITQIAIPHLLTADDVYKGYRLPTGTIVIPNAWAMLHDEKVYPEPFEFKPERFMKDGKLDLSIRDPVHAAFGFGRQIFPGRYMAFSAIWIAIALLIAAFDIKKAVDENGKVIEPSQEYLSMLVVMPLPFKCSIKPRSWQAEGLIRATNNVEY